MKKFRSTKKKMGLIQQAQQTILKDQDTNIKSEANIWEVIIYEVRN